MSEPRGIVQKLVIEPSPKMLWLQRALALFSEEEWIWSDLESDAFIFPTFNQAVEVSERLVANGERHIFSAVHREIPKDEVASSPVSPEVLRSLPGASRRPRVSAEESFAQLERRSLA